MKLLPIIALFAIGSSAAEMRACSRPNMGGQCEVRTSLGKVTGNWRSYNWRSSTNRCVKICSTCDELGWRCQSYSNNDIAFNKFIIFDWANGSGPGATSCC
ncbi:hypothetical protein P170DRAFT_504873 [Aspergillus steynii IBT 23096]|uniref:Uncharacterized protein n=1 Tax=Aspergillus steynii IBT 23096 TaxID=1392250 RepID=A0A2I2GME7_9EURO|nr:uncharacterized protein P170DRAFT_504873 [Aspergillus steynii IBT 23096]PLB54045.1 hypothetical protein P170DRAFT_504873 [Aspergillus steynii IBT 23096]